MVGVSVSFGIWRQLAWQFLHWFSGKFPSTPSDNSLVPRPSLPAFNVACKKREEGLVHDVTQYTSSLNECGRGLPQNVNRPSFLFDQGHLTVCQDQQISIVRYKLELLMSIWNDNASYVKRLASSPGPSLHIGRGLGTRLHVCKGILIADQLLT